VTQASDDAAHPSLTGTSGVLVVGLDVQVLEGMGRAIHTNLHALFSCDCLKVAMIKNQKVAETLFQGNIYDCMCKFEPGYCAQ
jgi:type II pantothenate kinase